ALALLVVGGLAWVSGPGSGAFPLLILVGVVTMVPTASRSTRPLRFLARTIGRHSLVATVAVRDIAEYTEVVRGLRGLPGVAAAETWIHAAVWTERYDWSLERLVGRRGARPREDEGP
ncbi:hypothetical protein NBM05_08570, partial [Rothia sp. AR01]|nr:hypothetical protein [Rothia santali]